MKYLTKKTTARLVAALVAVRNLENESNNTSVDGTYTDDDELMEENGERPPRKWVREWIAVRDHVSSVFEEVERADITKFVQVFRMTPDVFYSLLNAIEHRITKRYVVRKPIAAKMRLQMTLLYLATGSNLRAMEQTLRIPANTLCGVIPDTCRVIWEELQPQYLTVPTSESEWQRIMTCFQRKWNYVGALGAVDGKHCRLEFKPDKEGSIYYNYKGYHSVVLLAVADADCRFLYIDVGRPGSSGDAGVWRRTPLRAALEDGRLRVPEGELRHVPGVVPHLIGDGAFPLGMRMMKPFAGNVSNRQAIFNYRLSRARRCVESAFGQLSQRFRIFLKGIPQRKKENVRSSILAACVLHNFVKETSNNALNYSALGSVTDNGTSFDDMQLDPNRSGSDDAHEMRRSLMDYYNGEGSLDYQWARVGQSPPQDN